MIQGRLPSGRVVSVDTDDPKIAAATLRAYVAKDPYESTRARLAKDPVAKNTFGALATAERAVPFLTEAGAGVGAAADTLGDIFSGKGADFGKAWKKNRAVQQADVDAFKADHPVLSGTATAVGTTAPIAAAILSGGLTEAPTAAEAVEPGVAALLKRVALRTAGRATAGAGAGYLSGVSQPGTLAERGQSGAGGAAAGAVVGAVAPPLLDAAGNAIAKGAGKVATTVSRAANKATGGTLLDANQTAARRLTEALQADGADPAAIRTAMNGFLKNGAADPSLIDVASRLPSGGSNTLALVRAAGAKGTGRGVASTYADQVAADLQDRALAHTAKLTPEEAAPALKVREAAVKARGVAADREYGAPYDSKVDAAPVLPALEGDAGRSAISTAYKAADARRLAPQMAELDKLRAAAGEETPVASIAGEQLPASPALSEKIRTAMGLSPDDGLPVSLGTLDRIKIALHEAGDAAVRGENPSLGGGYHARAGEIDQHLADSNPDYATARDGYARRSAQIEALDHGATGVTAMPDEYAANLHDFLQHGGEDAGKMAAVGYRQALADRIGAPTEGATGALNRAATSTNQGRNLEATFGPDVTEAYRGGLKDLVDQLQNARSINPNTGSPTAMRLADMGLVEPRDVIPPRLSPLHIVLGAVNKIRAGATLTDAEREAIARIGTSRADPAAMNVPPKLKMDPTPELDELRAYLTASGVGQNRRDTP